jgi:hypothetical protein
VHASIENLSLRILDSPLCTYMVRSILVENAGHRLTGLYEVVQTRSGGKAQGYVVFVFSFPRLPVKIEATVVPWTR